MIIDDMGERLNTIFVDELEFFMDLTAATKRHTETQLRDPAAKIRRLSREFSEAEFDASLVKLRAECQEQIDAELAG